MASCVADRELKPRVAKTSVRHRRGFTLIEMLVAMTVTLILIFALAQVFAIVGESVAEGRATLELAGSLRSVGATLQDDLDGVTVTTLPPADDAEGEGYLEAFEGVGNDLSPLPGLPMSPSTIPARTVSNSYGDIDDVLAFTSRRKNGLPFTGFHYGTPVQSSEAEIIWFTRFEDRDGDQVPSPGEVTLYRRALLILPNYNLANGNTTVAALNDHFRQSDISARLTGSGIVANSLADLTKRENRFAHRPTNFPYLLSRAMLIPRGAVFATGGQPGFDTFDDNNDGTVDDSWEAGWFGSDDQIDTNLSNVVHGFGHDALVPNLLSFDVKLYDPYAEIRETSSAMDVAPGDPAWGPSGNSTIRPAGRGAFVDLAYQCPTVAAAPADPWIIEHTSRHPASTALQNGISLFSGMPAYKDNNNDSDWDTGEPFRGVYNSPLAAYAPTFGTSYCTWSKHYERDGVDQDGDGLFDEGTNGSDDAPFNGIVDDVTERETSPPYPFPLRGLQVSIRVIDTGSRQIRQTTVVADFLPE